MKKQILTISVIIALLFLATMPTASSDANKSGKVWSDGYVELTLNEMERTDTLPPEFFITPFERVRPPPVGQDFVVFNLTITRIEGRYNVLPSSSDILLFDDKGNNYTCGGFTFGVIVKNETLHLKPAEEGSSWTFYSRMPKNRKPVHLRFVYTFTESWENISEKDGKIEIYLQATPTPIPTLTPTPTSTPATLPTATPTEIPVSEEKGVPGFEAIFAIMGLLAIVYILRKRR